MKYLALVGLFSVLALLTAAPAQSKIHLRADGINADAPFTLTAQTGDSGLSLNINLKKGWHMYGKKTKDGDPVVLRILEGSCFEAAGELQVPMDAKGRITGNATLVLPLRRIAPGTTVKARFHFTACDAEQCLPPGDIALTSVISKAQQAFDELTAEHDAAYSRYIKECKTFAATNDEYQALRKARDWRKASALRDQHVRRPYLDFLPRFEEQANKHKGKPEEARFLVWMVTAKLSQSPPQDSQLRALERLLTVHIQNPLLQPMVTAGDNAPLYHLLGFDKFVKVLGQVAKGSPHKLVQAHALYCRSIFNTTLRPNRAKPTKAQQEAAEASLRRVAELAPGTTLALRAVAGTFRKQRLGVGMVAPEIRGRDLDGVPFKLSDYRGKVVVLDFWGDW